MVKMERLTRDEIVAINKAIGEGGVEINTNLYSIVYLLDEVDNVEDYASKLLVGITRLHPFLEGNKRTAFFALAMFLDRNGCSLKRGKDSRAEAVDLMKEVCKGKSRRYVKKMLRKMIDYGKHGRVLAKA